MSRIYFSGSKDIKDLLKKCLSLKFKLDRLSVLDFPAGSGDSSEFLNQRGSQVTSWDAFPEFFKFNKIECRFADLQKPFPSTDKQFDFCIFQEGIEHLQDQLFPLREFHRVLKENGTLIVTTPNYSNFRSRLSYFFYESETPKIHPPNEIDSIWYGKDQRIYYGHIFSIGIMRLRMLGYLAGFKLQKIHPARVNHSSLLIGLIALPFVLIKTILIFIKHKNNSPAAKQVYSELLKLNLHPSVLFGGHLIVEFVKQDHLMQFRDEKITVT